MKKIFLYIILLIPWSLSNLLFNGCLGYFDTLNLPFFALPKPLYGIVWTVLYLLITYSIYKVYTENRPDKDYNISLFVNYIFNQAYLGLFFCLQNPLLGFIDCLLILISSLFLYIETKNIDDDASKFLIPYVIFNMYATILSLSIYFMNL